MKRNYLKLAMTTVVAATTLCFASCKDENTTNNASSDENAATIAAQFVDHTVAPTYTALAGTSQCLYARRLQDG